MTDANGCQWMPRYKVWLYDLFEKEWCQVEVDEFLPCTMTDGRPRPTFARPLGNELWVMLLEKALAKFCSSYGALNAGYPGWAFQVLTGKSDLTFFLNEGKHWRKCAVKKPDSKEDARNPRSMRMVYCGWGGRYNTDDLFKFLKTHIEDKHASRSSFSRFVCFRGFLATPMNIYLATLSQRNACLSHFSSARFWLVPLIAKTWGWRRG